MQFWDVLRGSEEQRREAMATFRQFVRQTADRGGDLVALLDAAAARATDPTARNNLRALALRAMGPGQRVDPLQAREGHTLRRHFERPISVTVSSAAPPPARHAPHAATRATGATRPPSTRMQPVSRRRSRR